VHSVAGAELNLQNAQKAVSDARATLDEAVARNDSWGASINRLFGGGAAEAGQLSSAQAQYQSAQEALLTARGDYTRAVNAERAAGRAVTEAPRVEAPADTLIPGADHEPKAPLPGQPEFSVGAQVGSHYAEVKISPRDGLNFEAGLKDKIPVGQIGPVKVEIERKMATSGDPSSLSIKGSYAGIEGKLGIKSDSSLTGSIDSKKEAEFGVGGLGVKAYTKVAIKP
jgi:hypothetical protein